MSSANPITPQKVRAVLRKAGFAESHKNFGEFTSGFRAWNRLGEIEVWYTAGSFARTDQVSQDYNVRRIAAALAAAGIACKVRDRAVWVAVDQADTSKDEVSIDV